MSCSCSFPTQIFAPLNAGQRSLSRENNLNTGLAQNIVAMITSNMTRSGHPSRVALVRNSIQGRESGILMDSVVMTDNLATIREMEIDRTIGNVSDTSEIDRALRHTLGLT